MSYRGWNSEIEILGHVIKEDIGTIETDLTESFYVSRYLMTASDYSTPATSSDILVYTTTRGDLPVHNGSYAVNASDGIVTLDPGSWRNVDDIVHCTYYSARIVGYATGLTLALSNGLEPIYTLGARTPYDIVDGNAELTGSFDELFIDRRPLGRAIAYDNASRLILENVRIKIPAGSAKLWVESAIVNDLALENTQDGIVSFKSSFTAKNCSIY